MPTGKTVKRRNTIISLAVLIPAAILCHMFHPSALTWCIGIFGGLVWANWFEYFYHRWLDHTPGNFFERKHRAHHAEPEHDGHINFGENPIWTLAVYAINGLPVVLADLYWLHSGISAVLLTAFIFYVLLTEEVHWQIHTGGWVPFKSWRDHHLAHHKRPLSRFNVFFPLFDWLFRTMN